MDNLDRGLLNYIAKKTQSPLDAQIAFFNENVDKRPKEMIGCVRSLAEATVEYLYFFTTGASTIPGPYWGLVFKSNEYNVFVNACDKCKKKGYAYPTDYDKMWAANQLLKDKVSETFIVEANSVKKLGNMVIHNKRELANLDLPREARKCLDSYNYLLSEVNRLVSAGCTGTETGRKMASPAAATDGHINRTSGNEEHFPQTSATEEKGSSSTFDVKKWFAGVQAELARERTKTQEDYDMEDNENF